jgi:hypothetical protein
VKRIEDEVIAFGILHLGLHLLLPLALLPACPLGFGLDVNATVANEEVGESLKGV